MQEIAKAEMKAREKAPSVTATIKLDRNKLKLLLLSDFAASHPEVDMKIDMEHKEVKLTGDDRAVMTAKLHVYETTQYPAEERVKVSSGVAAFLKTEKGRMHFEGCLQGNQLKVAFGVEEETVKLFALKSEDLEKAKRVMTQCVSESTIPFDADSVEVLKSKEATLLFKSLQGKHLICIHLGKKNVWIVGPPHDVATVKEDIGTYISTNTIITVSVDTSEGCTKFLQEYKKDDIAEVERQHMEQAVKITSRATGGFSITGTKDGTQEAKKKLEKLVTDVKKVSKEITKPGMYKFLTGETGRALLDVAGRENRCLIIPDVPSRGRGGPNTPGYHPDPDTTLEKIKRCVAKIRLVFRLVITDTPTSLFHSATIAPFHLTLHGTQPMPPFIAEYYSVSYSSQVSVRRYSAPKPAGNTSFPVSTPRELTLHLFGPDQDRIDRATKAVDSIVVKNCQEQKIQNPAITMLTAQEARMIHTYGEDRDVVVKQGSGVDCLLIQGAIHDVTEVLKRIWTVLNAKVEEQRRDWGKAHSVQKDAQWSYVVTQGREQKIDPAANAIIEAAYKAKKSSVKYDDDNEDCEIDFKAMRVTLKQSKRSFPVQRRDKKADVGGGLPSTWDPQPQDRSTKQLKLCHIVHLKSGSQEYRTVAGKFTNSLQGMRATIVSIERVQNPTLWRHYCAQRQKVAQINPRRTVEQELWHGTKKEVTEVITHNGFNRSYSGGNVGCWEGQGSYFALKAAYSTKDYYSVPDPTTKHKKMFLCKVTTGEYTKGAADMTKAPMRSDKPNVPFDSTVNDVNNPTVFVIFHDAQAYPEYLITFKMS
ncbi:positive regulation of interleukin-4-mediated signaling pathway [Branchiostoma belcheri]|nr:positive regulation of interleukin-4-mediated signaling pathway [Branchiostoma belcheri]